nr:hypothetical protein [Tanacetum cinerariifolium]
MIAILEKYEHNQDFHQIVDFVVASHIRYTLTFNPTVYVSHIRKFLSTARIETTEKGTKILATVDCKLRTVSESSIRRNFKLNDEAGISSLPDAELFENLTLMGNNISPNQKQYTRRARIAQSSALPPVADEPASPIGDDSQGKACHTDSGLEADQDRANIPKTSTFPSDLTPRVTSLAADEGSMQQKLDELTALCTSLQRQQSEMVSKFAAQELEITNLKARVKLLEDREGGGIAEQSGDNAPIKGRRLDEGKEAAERVMVPTAIEVAIVTVSIPTSSGVVSTASPTIPTASPIFTTATESTSYTRRKGKETMVESETPKKKKIARDAEIERIHAEEELQMLIDRLDRNNETVAKYLQEYYQFAAEFPIERRIELIKEAERFKRKGVRLEQDSSKKLKTSEEVPEEKLKEIIELIPVEEGRFESVMGISKRDSQHQASHNNEFPLPEQLPTTYEDKFPLLIQSDATVKKIARLLKTGVSHGQRRIYTIQRLPTPMVEQAKLKLDLVGKLVDHTDYRNMIGSLMYFTSSRPDIMFATCMCARYQANPNKHHVSAVKRIFRYLKVTINLGLWYPKDFGFDLTAYSDADHAGCHIDRKKYEYVAVSGCCAEVIWMRTQLKDYGFFYDKVPIYCDLKSAIAISCNPVQHTRTKHIDV